MQKYWVFQKRFPKWVQKYSENLLMELQRQKDFFGKSNFKFTDELWIIEGENITDKKIPDADSYILSFWNDKDIQNALHTVSMRKSKDGYELFNYDNPINNSSKEFESLTEKMGKKNNVPLVLHCIYKEDK